MPIETTTKNGRAGVKRTSSIFAPPEEEQALRELALEQLKRVRAFKLHVVTWAVGVPVLGFIWMMSEYFQDSQWPTRFADSGGPDTWNPWFFWAAGIWTAVLLFHGVRTYTASRLREPTHADVDREVERLKARR